MIKISKPFNYSVAILVSGTLLWLLQEKVFFLNGKGNNLLLIRKFCHLKEIYLLDFQAYQS